MTVESMSLSCSRWSSIDLVQLLCDLLFKSQRAPSSSTIHQLIRSWLDLGDRAWGQDSMTTDNVCWQHPADCFLLLSTRKSFFVSDFLTSIFCWRALTCLLFQYSQVAGKSKPVIRCSENVLIFLKYGRGCEACTYSHSLTAGRRIEWITSTTDCCGKATGHHSISSQSTMSCPFLASMISAPTTDCSWLLRSGFHIALGNVWRPVNIASVHK